MGLQADLVAVVDGNVSGRWFRAAVGHRGRSRPLGALRVTECGAEGVDGVALEAEWGIGRVAETGFAGERVRSIGSAGLLLLLRSVRGV